MTSSQNSSASPRGIDKEALYGEWLKGRRWRDRLYKQAAHKALDVPESDDVINVTNTRSGWGWKEALAIGALGLGGYALTRPAATPTAPTPPQITPPAIHAPADRRTTQYSVDFFDPTEELKRRGAE